MTERREVIGPITQKGAIRGLLISIGGAGRTVRVQLQKEDNRYTGIETTRETARDLAKHMYEYVELNGTGRWLRDETGTWVLKKFKIESFKVLKATSLDELTRQLQAVEGSEWIEMDDPFKFLRELRHEDEN